MTPSSWQYTPASQERGGTGIHAYPGSLRGMVDQWAAERPDRPALLAPNRTPCSWRDLAEQVDETAAAFARFDVGPGHVVAVVMPDGPESAAAIVAAGATAACAPLNRQASEDELTASLENIGAAAVVLSDAEDGAARRAAMRSGLPVFEVVAGDVCGRFSLGVATEGASRDRRPSVDEDIALVIETSGTTGRPKVVARTQQQACGSAQHSAEALGLGPDDRSLVVLPLCFGYGRDMALLAGLMTGGAAICTSGFDSRRFFEWVDDLRATWVAATPPMHHALAMLARVTPERAAESSLRLLRSGSAPLERELLESIETAFQAPLLVAYASTEAGIIASERPPPMPRKQGTVGTSAGAEIVIVGDDGAVLGPDELGEIVVRSEWANGAPALDVAVPGDGWMRTGDLGRLDADGFLSITGRVKELINRGGEKVSPTEVEAVLLAHPSVAEAVVFAVPHRTLGEEVAAVVVGAGGAALDTDDVRRHAGALLTPNKVPRRIVPVDEIPLSQAGKVQRIGMAELLGLTELGPETVEEARTPLEATVARVWAQALGLERVSLTTGFLDLGGDSLAAVEVMALIDEECGVQLPEEWLLQDGATVTALANAIEESSGGASHHMRGGPVRLRAGAADRRPFFCLPGIRGNALMLHRLATATTSDRPFYAMRAPGLTADETPPDRMNELAAFHVEHIRKIQPAGPYTVGGFSFGGFIAFEIAHQLRAQGEDVDRLVILDTFAPGFEPKRSFGQRVKRAAAKRLKRVRSTSTAPAPATAARARTRPAEAERVVERVKSSSRRALRTYRPEPVDVPVAVLSTESRRARVGGDTTLGWGALSARPPETHGIPGRHRAALDPPHVETLGAVLGSILDREQERS